MTGSTSAAGAKMRAEDIPVGRRSAAFALLMVFEFFYGWSWNTVDVLRPQIRESLDLTLTQAGSAYTAQSLGALIGAITFGMLADHIGRRRVLFVIVAGTATMAAAGALVWSYPTLLLQRFILGLFLGGNFPVLIGTYMGLFGSGIRGKLTSIGQGTYSISVMALGLAYGSFAERSDWHLLLLIGSVPALLLSPLIFWLVPDDRRMSAWGAADEDSTTKRLPLLELFSAAARRRTLLLFLLVSLNFFAYQAFAGWTTTFLKDDRGLEPAVIGQLVSAQFIGATIGGFFWGWFSDRYGRRLAAAGFFMGAAAAAFYLLFAATPFQLAVAGFCWGFAINASVAWAPWIAEMFPVRMRSTAMSIFNWGRIISMTAPLVTGAIAASFGLGTAMLLSVVGFGLGGLVWLMLPETVERRQA
jgi:MFS family permease